MITNKLIYAFLNCNYKALLINENQKGEICDFEQLQFELLDNSKKSIFQQKILKAERYHNHTNLGEISTPCDHSIFVEPYIKNTEYDINIDLLEFTANTEKPTWILYSIIPNEKLQNIDKIYLTILSLILKNECVNKLDTGIIIFGKDTRKSKVLLNPYIKKAQKVLNDLSKSLSLHEEIHFNWNKHCDICEFQKICLKKLTEKDDLSLLRRLSQKEIIKLNNKGIFTINQFSYTYKPKKKKKNEQLGRLEYSLKALSIREKRTFVKEVPKLPNSNIQIFLDVESLNDENFCYLIGLYVSKNAQNLYFWSDSRKDLEQNFIAFLNIIAKFEDYTLYHYGSHDINTLNKINKQLNNGYTNQVECIIKRSYNVLPLFSSHIYPPTYSNGLKEIAKYIGFNWNSPNASGLQSIVWRKRWELTKNEKYKQLIIKYNQDDCLALKVVTEWIDKIGLQNIDENDEFTKTDSLKVETYHKWGKQDFKIPEFEALNKCTYFNYQREKIFFRTNKTIKKALINKKRSIKIKNRVNKVLNYLPLDCPKCGCSSFYALNNRKFLIIDIKFMENGIKKLITQLNARSFECKECYFVFGFNKYGRNLMIWSVNQYISYFTSMPKIQKMLKEYFNINVTEHWLYDFKSDLANEFQNTYNEIKETILGGNLLHSDETKTSVKTIPNGYVWVFTNMDTVYYFYKPNRKADFLKEMLKDFKGVIVSDYYPGYYSLPCQQQKCLVHLIRDMNNDLLANQFNEEYKELVSDFGKLLKKVIETIDEYGLQKKYLENHITDVEQFYNKILGSEYKTDLAVAYQKRLKRNKGKLFNFIHYDNIPWNNNNAENAIKPLAKYRTRAKGLLREKGLKEYLVLLSIQQTCVYRGINFLDFLKSKEKSINKYSKYSPD